MRNIPAMHLILNTPELKDKIKPNLLAKIIRQEINKIKENSPINLTNEKSDQEHEKLRKIIIQNAQAQILKLNKLKIKRVINCTGVILNTNLGRIPMAQHLIDSVASNLTSYIDLEQDIIGGERIDRLRHISEIFKFLTDCEDCLVVNNNASAVMLIVNSLSKNLNVVISRQELIEIGGNFRLPDIIAASGGLLKEIGTTNRTKPQDYTNATDKTTGIILKCHLSNFQISGFTQSVSIDELAKLKLKAPIVYDLGSAFFTGYFDQASEAILSDFLLNDSIIGKTDLISFSGDKLFGGCQAGIILGKTKYIKKLKSNPLYRACRVDKITVMLLENLLINYLKPSHKINLPAFNFINQSQENLKLLAQSIAGQHNDRLDNLTLLPCPTQLLFGGGNITSCQKDSFGIEIISKHGKKTNYIHKFMRNFDPPILGVAKHDKFVLDLATLLNDDYDILLTAIYELDKNILAG